MVQNAASSEQILLLRLISLSAKHRISYYIQIPAWPWPCITESLFHRSPSVFHMSLCSHYKSRGGSNRTLEQHSTSPSHPLNCCSDSNVCWRNSCKISFSVWFVCLYICALRRMWSKISEVTASIQNNTLLYLQIRIIPITRTQVIFYLSLHFTH